MKKMVGFGDYMLRLNPEGYLRFLQADRFLVNYTGAEANVCVSLAMMGMDTDFVTRLPENDIAAAGLVATLANNIPMFQMMGDMDRRGKIINVAFAVSAAFVFGDHLGFTAGFDADMIFPMIVGKLVGGITAVAVAMLLTRKEARG